jgi:hypothetical protein
VLLKPRIHTGFTCVNECDRTEAYQNPQLFVAEVKISFNKPGIIKLRTDICKTVRWCVRFEVLTVVTTISTVFWNVMACSLVKVHHSGLAYWSTLKMETVNFLKMLVDFYQTAQNHITSVK